MCGILFRDHAMKWYWSLAGSVEFGGLGVAGSVAFGFGRSWKVSA